jgi:hypothetical protein
LGSAVSALSQSPMTGTWAGVSAGKVF